MFSRDDRERALVELRPYIIANSDGSVYQPAAANPEFNIRIRNALNAHINDLTPLIGSYNNLVRRLRDLQHQLTDQLHFLRERERSTNNQGTVNRGTPVRTTARRQRRQLGHWFSPAAITQLHELFSRLDRLSGVVIGVNGLTPRDSQAHQMVSAYGTYERRTTSAQFALVRTEMEAIITFISGLYSDGTIAVVANEASRENDHSVEIRTITNEVNKFGETDQAPFGRFLRRYANLHRFDDDLRHMNPNGTINFHPPGREELSADANVTADYRQQLSTGGVVFRDAITDRQQHNLINSSLRININWNHPDLIPLKRYPGLRDIIHHPLDISLALSMVRFFKYIKPMFQVEEVYTVGIDRPPLGLNDPHSSGRAIDLSGFKVRIPASRTAPEHSIYLHLRSGRPLHPVSGEPSPSADMEGYDEAQYLPDPAPAPGANPPARRQPARPSGTGTQPARRHRAHRPIGPSDWFNMASVNDPNIHAYNDNLSQSIDVVSTDTRQAMLRRISVIMTGFFSRVQGPGSDVRHMDHIHVDAMENYVPLGTLVNGVYECPATNQNPFPYVVRTRQPVPQILQPIAWNREQRRNREMSPDTVFNELRPFLTPDRRGNYFYTITYGQLEPEMAGFMRLHSSEVQSLINGYRQMRTDLNTLRQRLTNQRNFLRSRQPAQRPTIPPTTPPAQNTTPQNAPNHWFTNAGLTEALRILTMVNQLNNTTVSNDGSNYRQATENRLVSELSPRNQAGLTSLPMVLARINAVHSALETMYGNSSQVIRNTSRNGPPEPVVANRATITGFEQVLNRLNAEMPAFESRYNNATEFQQIREYRRHNEANNNRGVKVNWDRLIPLKRYPGGPGIDHPIDIYLALAMKRYFTVLKENRYNVLEVYCSGFRHYPMRHDPEAAMSVNITGFKVAVGNRSPAREIILHLRSGYPYSSGRCSADMNVYTADSIRVPGPSDWFNYSPTTSSSPTAYSDTPVPGASAMERRYLLRLLIWAAQPFFARIRIPSGDHPNANSFQMEYRSSGTPADHGSLD